jgi:hypothetical protein
MRRIFSQLTGAQRGGHGYDPSLALAPFQLAVCFESLHAVHNEIDDDDFRAEPVVGRKRLHVVARLDNFTSGFLEYLTHQTSRLGSSSITKMTGDLS